jgi:hypothetical protein
VVTITDDDMRQMMPLARAYSLVILKAGPQHDQPGAGPIIWEHGRRNFALRREGRLVIVCPVRDGSEVCGIGIYNATLEETRQNMDDDPGVKAGVFVYDAHACRSFPGDRLP